jgi:hypothetical protein
VRSEGALVSAVLMRRVRCAFRCNIMQCRNCDIFWNWRTRETGRSSRELKELARQRGTLWEVCTRGRQRDSV